MRYSLLVYFSFAAICPVLACAAPASTPCDFVDREALIAFKLADPRTTVSHQDIPAAKGAPQQTVDTCTITPAGQSLPSLTVTAFKLPAGSKAAKPLCSGEPVKAMEIASCSATIRDSYVSFTMLAKGSPSSTIKPTLAAQVDRLATQGAAPGPSGTPRR